MKVSVRRVSELVRTATSCHGILTGCRRIVDFINTEHINFFLLQVFLQFNFVKLSAHTKVI